MPVGNGSLTPTPASAVLLLGLVIVRVRVEVAFTPIVARLKVLVIVGGARTAKVAEAVPPVPPLQVKLPVVLGNDPAEAAVTLTDTAHVPLAAIEPPLRLIEGSPAFGEKVPLQVFVAPGVLATSMAEGEVGKVSLTATPVSAVLVGLVIVSVRTEVPPGRIEVGLKVLAIVGTAAGMSASRMPPFLSPPDESVAVPLPVTPMVALSAHAAPMVVFVPW